MSMRSSASLGFDKHSQATLEVTQERILNQSSTDATRFWWHLYER